MEGMGLRGSGEAAPLVGEDSGESLEPAGYGPANIGRSDAEHLIPEVRENAANCSGIHLVGGQVILKPREAVGDGLELRDPGAPASAASPRSG